MPSRPITFPFLTTIAFNLYEHSIQHLKSYCLRSERRHSWRCLHRWWHLIRQWIPARMGPFPWAICPFHQWSPLLHQLGQPRKWLPQLCFLLSRNWLWRRVRCHRYVPLPWALPCYRQRTMVVIWRRTCPPYGHEHWARLHQRICSMELVNIINLACVDCTQCNATLRSQ